MGSPAPASSFGLLFLRGLVAWNGHRGDNLGLGDGVGVAEIFDGDRDVFVVFFEFDANKLREDLRVDDDARAFGCADAGFSVREILAE